MCLFKWLNNLLFIENLLGIYRTYSDQRTIKKYLIIFQIFVQTILHTCLVILHAYFFLHTNELSSELIFISCYYSFSTYITATPVIVTGIYYCCAFKSYVESICRVSEKFKHDIRLASSCKRVYWISSTMILFFVAFVIHRSVMVVIQYGFTEMLVVGPILISQSILRVTVVLQQIMFFVVIMIVCILSKHFTSLISTVQKSIGLGDITSDSQFSITSEQIKGWVELYRDLSNCCVQVTLCFGRQFVWSLILALVYYVILTYQICYIHSYYREAISDSKDIVMIICCNLIALITPLIVGQKTNNQGVKFLRELVRLYNTMIVIDSIEAERKLIKDFICLTKKNPIEIKLMSKIPAGMYLLPVIFTLAVNYLIVMLQFMHVV